MAIWFQVSGFRFQVSGFRPTQLFIDLKILHVHIIGMGDLVSLLALTPDVFDIQWIRSSIFLEVYSPTSASASMGKKDSALLE